MAEEVILTKEGKEELEKRLEYLKVTKREEITERIKTAREFGDLSENAEYDEAKNEQGILEAKIAELEWKIANAEIVDASQLSGDEVNIIFGAMYDETKSGCCMITVIATGIEDVANVPNRMATGFTYKAPVTPGLKPMSAPVASGMKFQASEIPATPIQGINKPVDIRSNVQEKSLKIPDFLQRK